MRRLLVVFTVMAGWVFVPAATLAADLYSSGGQCYASVTSKLASQPVDIIEQTVSKYHQETKAALNDRSVQFSRSPAFVWAQEARYQCGKALGYLQSGYVDESSIGKCDCFYNRYFGYRY